jgi:hypothetical protein
MKNRRVDCGNFLNESGGGYATVGATNDDRG